MTFYYISLTLRTSNYISHNLGTLRNIPDFGKFPLCISDFKDLKLNIQPFRNLTLYLLCLEDVNKVSHHLNTFETIFLTARIFLRLWYFISNQLIFLNNLIA